MKRALEGYNKDLSQRNDVNFKDETKRKRDEMEALDEEMRSGRKQRR